MTQGNKNNPGDRKSPVFYSCEILDGLIHPACILTSKSIIEHANPQFLNMFGIGAEEKKFDWPRLFSSDYKKSIAQNFVNALNGAFTSCQAEVNTGDNDEKIAVEILMQPVMHEGYINSTLVLVKPCIDENPLNRLSSLAAIDDPDKKSYFEFSPFPMMRFGKDMKVIKLSRSFEGTFGYTLDDLVSGECKTVTAIFKYDSEKIKNSILEVFRGNIPFKRFGEIKIKTKSGDEKIVNMQTYPVYRDRDVQSVDLVMEDMTRLRELKDKLSAMKRLNLINDIGRGFVHSINNTINVILNQTQLLQIITEKDTVNDGLKQIEKYVHEVVEQLRRIQGFLGERGSGDGEKEESLAAIINDAVEFVKIHFKVDENRKKRSIVIENEYNYNFDIKADTIFLRELLIWAMLKVSVYAGKKGTMKIGFVKNNLYYITVSVINPGVNDTENIIPFTLDSYSPSEIRNEAEKFNIRVVEEESTGQYSVRIIFPQRMIIEKTDVTKEDTSDSIGERNIMIVEDEPVLQMILGNLFERMGNRVFITGNGTEGLEEFKKNNYDIVISDYDIAGITGIELSARVKEINENTITILLSGWSMGNMKTYRGFIDLFMAKPFNIDDLVRGITAIDKSRKV